MKQLSIVKPGDEEIACILNGRLAKITKGNKKCLKKIIIQSWLSTKITNKSLAKFFAKAKRRTAKMKTNAF